MEGKLNYKLISEFISIVNPDGVQLAPYYKPAWPKGNAIDYYACFQAMRGKDWQPFLNNVDKETALWIQAASGAKGVKGEAEDDV